MHIWARIASFNRRARPSSSDRLSTPRKRPLGAGAAFTEPAMCPLWISLAKEPSRHTDTRVPYSRSGGRFPNRVLGRLESELVARHRARLASGCWSGSPGRAFTRRTPTIGFNSTSCVLSSYSKLSWHNPRFDSWIDTSILDRENSAIFDRVFAVEYLTCEQICRTAKETS